MIAWEILNPHLYTNNKSARIFDPSRAKTNMSFALRIKTIL